MPDNQDVITLGWVYMLCGSFSPFCRIQEGEVNNKKINAFYPAAEQWEMSGVTVQKSKYQKPQPVSGDKLWELGPDLKDQQPLQYPRGKTSLDMPVIFLLSLFNDLLLSVVFSLPYTDRATSQYPALQQGDRNDHLLQKQNRKIKTRTH